MKSEGSQESVSTSAEGDAHDPPEGELPSIFPGSTSLSVELRELKPFSGADSTTWFSFWMVASLSTPLAPSPPSPLLDGFHPAQST